jgi:hypothetical protein
MTTIADSIKARLDADWTGAGGVEPTYYVSEDFRTMPPLGNDAVYIITSTHDTDVKPVNDTYVTEYHTITLTVNTITSEDRLKELSDEVIRILNATAITGATYQRYKGRKNVSDKDQTGIWNYQELITYDIRENMKSSAASYGAATTTTFTVDALTVNTSIAGSPTAALGATTVTGNIAVSGTVDGVDIAAEPARITAEIDADIATHEAAADPHAGYLLNAEKYTDAEVEAVITAELVNGQSIDNAIDALITTHAAVATAHQDTPALIATHAADDNAHHEVVEAHSDLSDTTLTGAYLEDLLMFGSANAVWVPCNFDGWTGQRPDAGAVGYRNVDATNPSWQFCLPLPTSKGSLKLYCSGVKVSIFDADAAAYVDLIRVMGMDTTTPFTAVYTDTTNMTSQDEWKSDDELGAWGAATDMSGYGQVKVFLNIVVDAAYELDINYVSVKCYYAT